MSKWKVFCRQLLSFLLCIYTLLCIVVSTEGTRDYSMPAEWILVYGLGGLVLMAMFGIAGNCKSNRWRWILFGSGVLILLGLSALEWYRELPPFVMWWRHLEYLYNLLPDATWWRHLEFLYKYLP